jgi:hypothetical protein
MGDLVASKELVIAFASCAVDSTTVQGRTVERTSEKGEYLRLLLEEPEPAAVVAAQWR